MTDVVLYKHHQQPPASSTDSNCCTAACLQLLIVDCMSAAVVYACFRRPTYDTSTSNERGLCWFYTTQKRGMYHRYEYVLLLCVQFNTAAPGPRSTLPPARMPRA